MSDITQSKSASTSTFVTALVFNAIVFAVQLAAFTLLRPWFKAIYEPRTYVPPPKSRINPLSPDSLFLWPWRVYQKDYHDVLQANGMDAYVFVRFLRMMARVFLPIWIVSWIVLLPVTSVGSRVGSNNGLDKFVFGNIENSKQERYAAHLLCVYLFTAWIFYNIKIEMRTFILQRQKYLISPAHAKSTQASTILITGVPTKYLSVHALRELFGDLPGGVKKIWINRNLKELPEAYDRRMKACAKLESAETALMKTAAKLRAEELKKEGKGKKRTTTPTSVTKEQDKERDPSKDVDVEATAGTKTGTGTKPETSLPPSPSLSQQPHIEVPRDQRPMHRLGFLGLPLIGGPKVDTIDWAREEIRVCNELLERGRDVVDREDGERGANDDDHDDPSQEEEEEEEEEEDSAEGSGRKKQHQLGGVKRLARRVQERIPGAHGAAVPATEQTYPPLNSAFVTFRKQIAAHLAVQVLVHHEPYRMSGKYIEVSPRDVIWENLNLNPYEQKIRTALGYAATAGLIILWAFPVAFVGIVSNVYALCASTSWLAWICTLPKVVVGIIAGILPPVLLAVLMMLLPIVLRLLARFEGGTRRSGLELELMGRFFVFQVVHSFLIVTLSAGIIKALPGLINNPTSVPNLLAQNLPASSTFFLTYVVLQGLAGVAGGFLQIVPLVLYYVKIFILGSTPRAVFGIRYGLRSVSWGTLFPGITLLVVIGLGYSIISPIINGLACATFFAFYQLYKYLFLYQLGQQQQFGGGGVADTGGLFFPKAIQHVFVGLYVQQICLAALFFLARDERGSASAVPEGALMIVLIVVTAGFHAIINNSYGPLLHALPLSLKDKTYSDPADDEDGRGGVDGRTSSESDAHKDPEAGQGKDKLASPKSEAEAKQEEGEVGAIDYGFAHPALSRPQRTVWIPKDELGVWEGEERGCREAGVDVALAGATMNGKGKVGVDAEEVYAFGGSGRGALGKLVE